MNRTERLYALAEELRAVAPRPRTARWLAARFEMCVRTIERDLAALMQAGVPIYGTRGRGGGYTLDRARTLPPINVTPAEATAAAVALRWLADTPFAAAARSLLRKVVAGMPTADALRAEDLARRVQIAGVPHTAPAAGVAADAVATGTALVLDYVDRVGRASSRVVEPAGYLHTADGWYLQARCRMRGAERLFRLDRIRAVRAAGTEASAAAPQPAPLRLPGIPVAALSLT
jgi:predicted DNA-binding transcriptional regulator YafY